MTKRLLNKKNLIIVIMLLCMFLLPNISYAATVNISTVFNQTVSSWFIIIRYVCLAVMLIGLIVLGIKAAVTTIAEEKATFKATFVHWLICLIIILLLHQFIYALIYTNENIVNGCKDLGEKLSGIDTTTSDDELDEVTLYETAVSKAYELKFTSGTIGMILYIMLVVYTIKFFFIYLKRYINVLILILISPVVFTIYAFRRVLQGRGGLVGTWVKELIYNIFIQSVHAAYYATLMGLTIRFMSDSLTAVGAILTIILFGFIFELDKIIRKLFNMVAGVKTVKTIDYESMIKHPVKTVDQFKGMATDAKMKFGEFKDNVQSGEIKEDITQGLIKFKNNATSAVSNAKNEIKETVKSLDGRNIEISKEAVEKEKKKMENPSIPAKILNGIQGFAYSTVGLGVTAVENISKKTKQELFRLKAFAKNQTEKLKQNSEMVKKIGFIIKNETKVRVNKMKNKAQNKVESNEEAKRDTVLNFNFPEIEIEELKNGIETSKGDIPAVVYAVKGPQAFIYKDVGSPHMGLSILASENYEKKIYKEPVKEKDRKTLSAPSIIRIKTKMPVIDEIEKDETEGQTIRNVQKIISIEEARKKYRFVRFNATSVKNITKGLNRRYVANDIALSTLAAVGQNIAVGGMSYRGTATPTIRRSSIKYTAKVQSHKQNKIQADIEAKKVIPFPSVWQRKQQLDVTLANYHERVQDGNWAVLGAISDDIVQTHEGKIEAKTEEIRKAENLDTVVKQLEDMGKAVRLNQNVAIIFGQDVQTASFNEDNKTARLTNEEPVKDFQMSNEEPVRFSQLNNAGTAQVATEISAEDAEATLEAVTDRAIIQTAIKLDMPLETIKFGENLEARKEVVTTLIDQGVIEAQVLKDDTALQTVIDGIENRQNIILTEKPSEYIDSVMQNEVIKTLKEMTQQTGNTDTSETVIDADFVQSEPDYDRLSDYIKKVAREAVKSEAQRMKTELMSEAQGIIDTAYEGIEEAKEVYSLEDLDKQAKEKIEATIEATKTKVKSAFKAKEPKEKKDTNSNADNRETFIVYVMGAVLLEGRYELPSGSRIYEAIKAAGGPTDEADLTAIPFYDFIYDGETIRIPKRSDDDIEKTLEKCRPIVEKVVKDYLVENNISDIEALKKLVHKKMLLSELQKALREQPVTKNQIANLLEERIKELKFIRDGLKKAKGNMKVVEKGKTKVKDSENIQNEKERQSKGVRNKLDTSLDEAIKKLNNFDEIAKDSEESNEKINDLLRQLDSQRELVLVNSSNSTKQEARLRYIDETPENMMNKLLGRV